MNIIEKYNKLNNSFKKELVFNFGQEAGFYSEFNNMVFAILFCLKYNYKFILYSASANFRFKNGWVDYFEPFCDSSRFLFHGRYNKRSQVPNLSRRDIPFMYFYRFINKKTYLTYQLWNKFFNAEFQKEHFNIPELNINGNLRESSRQIVCMIYKFNFKTNKEILTNINHLNLPQKYISLHIRRGDKKQECELAPLQLYINKLKEVSNIKEIFVSTDDYYVVEELIRICPDFHFYSLVDKNETGYDQAEFVKLYNQERKRKMMMLFSSIEIICKSEIFIGTYTSNIGLFIGMRMSESKICSIQKSSWYQFDINDVLDILVK